MTECGSQSSVETRQIILTGQIKVETPRNLSVFVGLLLLVQGGETIKGRPVASVCRRGLIPHVLPGSTTWDRTAAPPLSRRSSLLGTTKTSSPV